MANLETFITTNNKGKVKGKLKIAVSVKLPPALTEMPDINVKIDENPNELSTKINEKVPKS